MKDLFFRESFQFDFIFDWTILAHQTSTLKRPAADEPASPTPAKVQRLPTRSSPLVPAAACSTQPSIVKSAEAQIAEERQKVADLEKRLASSERRCKDAEEHAEWLWAAQLPCASHYTEYQVERLQADSPLSRLLVRLFHASCTRHRRERSCPDFCPAPRLEVGSVSSVSNPRLVREYLARKDAIGGLRRTAGCSEIAALADKKLPLCGVGAVDLNEHFLFHGAHVEVVEEICKGGFDPRRAGEGVGSTFGAATYFAANASKADIYTEPLTARLSRTATRRMLVARVILGESFCTKNWTPRALRPPDGADGRPLDSVWAAVRDDGGVVDHTEAMVYDRGQAMPIAVITYSHASGCTCAECLKRPVC